MGVGSVAWVPGGDLKLEQEAMGVLRRASTVEDCSKKDARTILVTDLGINQRSYCRFSGSRTNWRLLWVLCHTLVYHSQASRTTCGTSRTSHVPATAAQHVQYALRRR